VNFWLIGATILLVAVAPCGYVVLRRNALEALVGLELVSTIIVLVLLLIAEGYHRNSYYTLPLVLAFTNLAGALVFVRFFHDLRR
jgi:multisubunit Na+/H+ antiporter MnhF subunit